MAAVVDFRYPQSASEQLAETANARWPGYYIDMRFGPVAVGPNGEEATKLLYIEIPDQDPTAENPLPPIDQTDLEAFLTDMRATFPVLFS